MGKMKTFIWNAELTDSDIELSIFAWKLLWFSTKSNWSSKWPQLWRLFKIQKNNCQNVVSVVYSLEQKSRISIKMSHLTFLLIHSPCMHRSAKPNIDRDLLLGKLVKAECEKWFFIANLSNRGQGCASNVRSRQRRTIFSRWCKLLKSGSDSANFQLAIKQNWSVFISFIATLNMQKFAY